MNNKREDFISLLDDLCQMYESYAIKNIGSKIIVLIDKNSINIKVLNGEVVDDFRLNFNSKENNMCLNLSVVLLKILFNKFVLYNIDNKFYNNNKPYLDVTVLDNDMLNKILFIVMNERKKKIYEKIDKLNKKRYVNELEQRICLTRKLLRMDDRI